MKRDTAKRLRALRQVVDFCFSGPGRSEECRNEHRVLTRFINRRLARGRKKKGPASR